MSTSRWSDKLSNVLRRGGCLKGSDRRMPRASLSSSDGRTARPLVLVAVPIGSNVLSPVGNPRSNQKMKQEAGGQKPGK
jgi:hypothetical protein